LLYDAEYVESHALHIYLLQAPDLLGYESVLSLAEVAPEVVKNALHQKKIGNDLLKAIGGRSVHPVSSCVGGFYRWPRKMQIQALIPDLEWGLEAAIETVRWAATLPYPDFEILDYIYVAVHHAGEYGILSGNILSSKSGQIEPVDFEKHYIESHVRHSNALHSHTASGQVYVTGPMSRVNLNYEQMGPAARKIMSEIGLKLPIRNPYKQLLARAIELVEVHEEALRIARAYDPQGPSHANVIAKAGEGFGVSEAPRGLLYHHYVLDDQGMVRHARISPPTAQNLARIEADLWKLAPKVIDLPQEKATLECEHLVRSYDPCISCATHFLKLKIEDL